MAKYDRWNIKEQALTQQALRGVRFWRWALERPLTTCYALPWLIVVLPMLLLPTGMVEALGTEHLARVMSGIVPMIERTTATSLLPQWTRLTLALLWATGPLWTAATMAICFMSHRIGYYGAPAASFRVILAATAGFMGLIAVVATLSPRRWKRFDSVEALLSVPLGLGTIGWFIVAAGFITLGIVFANPLIRAFAGDEEHAP